MTAKITNGTISCGRTIKTGEYENKRFDVQLSFTIPEDGDAEVADYISAVGEMAMRQMNGMIAAREATVDEKKPVAVKAPKPAKAAAPKADAAEMEEYDRPEPPKKATNAADVEEVPALLKKEVAAQNAAAAEESIDDLLGGGTAAKEITDVELFDAANKKMAETKNGVAIRKLLAEVGVKQPSGRIIDIVQDKRQVFLDKLKDIKPLA